LSPEFAEGANKVQTAPTPFDTTTTDGLEANHQQ
jgi:hypothetical protein